MPRPMISHLRPRNLLSFGPGFPGIDLGALTVLIGPNACGKSNLLEAISLMRAAPRDFSAVTRKGGGAREWLWKGRGGTSAQIEWHFSGVAIPDRQHRTISHGIVFGAPGQSFHLEEEYVAGEPEGGGSQPDNERRELYRFGNRIAKVRERNGRLGRIDPPEFDKNLSVLAQLRDPAGYPELTWLGSHYQKIRIYREWVFGQNAVFREPQRADTRGDILEENFANLGLFLNRLKVHHPAAKRRLVGRLRDLYDGLADFEVSIDGGTVQVHFIEGDFSIPATRLSDGTLRYLCLLAILCDPDPPPLVCIEEPELGLHPDIIPKVADLLLEFSARTQVIVTTHSEILVDAMTECPESVVVCEKHDGQTEMTRLSSQELSVWLENYRLGQLWMDGEVGGKRW